MKKIISLLFLFAGMTSIAQNNINIVPMPAEIKMGKGIFIFNSNTTIVLEGSGLQRTAALFNDYLQTMYGYKLKITKNFSGNNTIRLNFERLHYPIAGAYTLTVNKKGIYIAGDNETGVFYGIQTLIQLLAPNYQLPTTNYQLQIPIPQLTITDYPRFAYRGMHLDVGRHFFPVDFIKKYIDYLAAYKYNTFHWHLTEDQGWRIEIKKYPLLTETGSCRNRTLLGRYGSNQYDNERYCGFYTQEEVKEIVKYSADHYITVIPEIEMPGHSTAALASYPFLGCTKGPYKVMDTWGVLDDVYCAGNDSTYQFIENVLDEVMALFPSKYIHIGGDECPKERWKTCTVCQKKIKEEGLKDEHALQSYFVQRIEKYLNSKGRKIIGWDEILEGGLAPNATVMSWRGEEGGIAAAKQNHDVIMTPGSNCYFDHSQSKNEDSITIGGFLPLENVYNYEPIPAVLNATEAKHILGAQGNVWTEYMTNTLKVEYMVFPRICALSEVLWTPKEKKNWNDFERRLPGIFKRLDEQKINYSKAYYDLKATVLPTKDNDGILLEAATKIGKIAYIPCYSCSSLLDYEKPILIKNTVDKMMLLLNVDGKTVSRVTQSFSFNKATGKKITLVNDPSKNYPGDGAFTLVNGVQNEKGLNKSNEFLGFLGTDLDATIDLGATMEIKKITLHVLDQNGSWIYLPKAVEIIYVPNVDYTTGDLKNFPTETKQVDPVVEKGAKAISIESKQQCRYIKIIAKNFGTIPSGNPGAGNPAWLFVDEIEVK